MKKFLTFLVVLVCSFAHAEYTAENKIIKVVIPQPPASGLASIYHHIENYANKQNIKMIPVFRPGAGGKIGIDYASKEKNKDAVLLFSTISDYVAHANDSDFDKIAPITKISLALVASKKSKIKNVNDIVRHEQENPGRLTWAHVSSPQVDFINTFAKSNNLDINKIYKVPFSANTNVQSSIINGDIDLAIVTPKYAKLLADDNRLTLVDIDNKTKEKLAMKENATGLFLQTDNNSDKKMFWNKFVKGLLADKDFNDAMKSGHAEILTEGTSEKLDSIITNWKL